MAWSTPLTATTGNVLTAAQWNSSVRDDLNALSTHIHGGGAGDGALIYSIVDYIFFPDAAAGVTVVVGNQQGNIYHSGPTAETAIKLLVDAKTAPGASGLPITVQYADTDDLDTASTWTTIATYTLSSEKSNNTASMTNASIPANRLLRMNVGTIVGSPADVTITMRVKRPISS